MLCIALILGAFGCGSAQPAATSTSTSAGTKAPGDAKVGDATTCPVSKEAFTVTASSPKAEFNGKTYYFCCGGCDKKFLADPKQYVGSVKVLEVKT